jgi:lipopolysaccharide exporter
MSTSRNSLLSGSLLVINALAKKTIGLVSTLILARVLVPDDFGIVAITMLALGFVEIFATTGSQHYILQKDHVNEEILNTAWSIDLILKSSVALILFILAPFIANYYGNEQLIATLRVIALMPVFNALRNPGIFLLQRNQNYGSFVKQAIIIKVIAVLFTISLALSLKSFWALIGGSVLVSFMECIGSYVLHPHRPKICFSNVRPQLVFTGWMTPQAIIGYLRTQLDTFMVSTYYGKAQLGSYHVMKYLAFMPVSEIITPATQPLLVELAKVRNNKIEFIYQFRLSLLIVMSVALPMAVFLDTFDYLFVELLLGKQWLEFSEVFGTMSLMVICFVMLNQCRRVLLVFQKTHFSFYYEVFSFVFVYGLIYLIGIGDIVHFTKIRVGLEITSNVLLLSAVCLYFIGVKSFCNLIVLHAPLFISAYLAITLTKLAPLTTLITIFKMPSYLVIFGFFYSLFLIIFYLIYYNNTREGRKIKDLFTKALKGLSSKLIRE